MSLESRLFLIKTSSEKIYPYPDHTIPLQTLVKKGILEKNMLDDYFRILTEINEGLSYMTPKDFLFSFDLFYSIRNKTRKKYLKYFLKLNNNLREGIDLIDEIRTKLSKTEKNELSYLINNTKEIVSTIHDAFQTVIREIPIIRLMKKELYDKIKEDSIKRYKNPGEEACGLLSGRQFSKDLVDIYHYKNVFPAKNISENPKTNYLVYPMDQLKAEEDAENAHLDIKAYYHSHPKDAVPSEYDLKHARGMGIKDYDFLIYGIEERRLRGWRLNNNVFEELFLLYL